MKKYLALVAVGLLTACSSEPVTNTESSFVEGESQLSAESSGVDLNSYVVNSDGLFIENGPGLAYFKTEPYLSMNESVSVDASEARYDGTVSTPLAGTVTLTGVEVFEDQQGSGRLGLLLTIKEENKSDQPLEVGDSFTAKNAMTSLAVFHEETQLKLHQNDVVETPDTEFYRLNQHVSYTSPNNASTCTTNQTLEPGESRVCHEVVSFAGTGDYFINFATDVSQSAYRTYRVTVE